MWYRLTFVYFINSTFMSQTLLPIVSAFDTNKKTLSSNADHTNLLPMLYFYISTFLYDFTTVLLLTTYLSSNLLISIVYFKLCSSLITFLYDVSSNSLPLFGKF